ncbi:YtxH domain-containing protein [Lacisediminihabitans sp.]|uniref:YtxH domain-containing protein n=1 Tax=Lacisediminihabitans sp. TaxID=2787631 RepID=UPI00374CF45B
MRGKLLFLVGLAAGYVLGTRAGRERYEQIKKATRRLWNDPRVQHQVKQAEDFAKDKAPEVADFLAEGAKKVVNQVSGRPARAKASTTRPAAAKQSAASSTDTAK